MIYCNESFDEMQSLFLSIVTYQSILMYRNRYYDSEESPEIFLLFDHVNHYNKTPHPHPYGTSYRKTYLLLVARIFKKVFLDFHRSHQYIASTENV